MDPESFNQWVSDINQSTPGDTAVQAQIDEFLANPDLVSMLLNFILSGTLNQSAIFFALKALTTRPNITDEERLNMSISFVTFVDSNIVEICRSNYIKELTLLFMRGFTDTLERGAEYINKLSQSSENGAFLAMGICKYLIEINQSLTTSDVLSRMIMQDLNFVIPVALAPIENQVESTEIIQQSCDLLCTLIKACKSGKSIAIPKTIMEGIIKAGGAKAFLYFIETYGPPISGIAIEILTLIMSTCPSSFPDGERTQFISETIAGLTNLFNCNLSNPVDMPAYIDLCRRLKVVIADLNTPKECKEFIKSVEGPTLFILSEEQMKEQPFNAELMLEFWIDVNESKSTKIVERRIIHNICKYITNKILTTTIDADAIGPLVMDGTSNFLAYFIKLLEKDYKIEYTEVVEVNDEEEEIRRRTENRIEVLQDVYQVAKERLQEAFSGGLTVHSAFLLEFVTLALQRGKDIVEFNNAMTYISSVITGIPLLTPESDQGSIALEMGIMKFFELITEVYFKNPNEEVINFLKENYHIVILFFQRFLIELQSDTVCLEIVPIMMKILNFNDFDEIPMQIIAQDEEFFQMFFGIDFFVREEEGRGRKTREFFSSIFNLGYMMPDASRVEALLQKVQAMITEDPNNALVYQMLSGAMLCKRLNLPYFINIIQNHFAGIFYTLIKDPNTPKETLYAVLKFLVIFTNLIKENKTIPSFSPNAFFCFEFLTSVIIEYISIMEKSPNDVTLYQIMSKILQALKNIIGWKCINIGVVEEYKKIDFTQIVNSILSRLMMVPLSTIMQYPKFFTRYMDFLEELFNQIPDIFFKLPCELQHHQIQICKSILEINDNNAVESASKPISAYIKVSREFRESDQIPEDVIEEIMMRCMRILIIEGKSSVHIAEIIRLFSLNKPEVIEQVIGKIEEQIPPKFRNESIIYIRTFKNSFPPTFSNVPFEQSKKIISAAKSLYSFLFKKTIKIEI